MLRHPDGGQHEAQPRDARTHRRTPPRAKTVRALRNSNSVAAASASDTLPAAGSIESGRAVRDESALSPSLSVRSMMRVDGESAKRKAGGRGTSDAATTAT